MVKFSFYKMKYVGARKFVGLDNYRAIFKRDDIIGALKLCLYYMAGALIQLAIALYLATILSMKVKCSNLFKGFMFFPYLIDGIAIGFIFKFFYTRGFVFDTVLQWCGFQLDNLPYWLKDQSVNNWSLVGSSVWRYFGQNMVLFIGAIMSVDDSLYEAADLDGANKFQQFRYIILPSIKTIVTLNIILSITGSLSAFEAPFVITTGANGTGTFFVVMNTIAHTNQKVGLASAMAVFLLIIIIIAKFLQDAFCFTAFKTDAEYKSTNVMTLPQSWLNFDNFVKAFTKANMLVAFRNSLIVLVVVLAVSIIIGTQLAYVLNRFKFPGNGLIRNAFTFAALLPAVAMQVAVYEIMVNLNFVNTLYGYIIMMCGTDVISIYIFIQYFENLPVSLDESAYLDGASYFTIYSKILLPLLKPAIVTSIILKGANTYNEYYCAQLYLQDKTRLCTVATSLYTFTGPLGSQYNLICAGVIISLLPALIVFIIFQNQIYSGVAAGAVKG